MSILGYNETFNVSVTSSILEEILNSLEAEELLDFLELNNEIFIKKRKEGVI